MKPYSKKIIIISHEPEQLGKKLMTWFANLTSIKKLRGGVGSHTFENAVFEMEFGEPR